MRPLFSALSFCPAALLIGAQLAMISMQHLSGSDGAIASPRLLHGP